MHKFYCHHATNYWKLAEWGSFLTTLSMVISGTAYYYLGGSCAGNLNTFTLNAAISLHSTYFMFPPALRGTSKMYGRSGGPEARWLKLGLLGFPRWTRHRCEDKLLLVPQLLYVYSPILKSWNVLAVSYFWQQKLYAKIISGWFLASHFVFDSLHLNSVLKLKYVSHS